MRPQYSHDLITSTILWMDNLLCNTGQAYVNVTGSLYREAVTGGRNVVYASPYRGWVFDSCVGGAIVPNGFMNSSGQFLTRSSGLVIDFINGKVSCPQNWGPTLSGVYSRKEMNVYFSSDDETRYVMEQVYGENRNVAYTLTGLGGKVLTAPLAMITNGRGENVPWALGGMDDSKNTVRAFIISDSNYLQEGVNSLLQDSAHQTIPFAPYSAAPITASGDLKTVGWSYCQDIYGIYGCTNGLYIKNVYDYKVSDKANKTSTFLLSCIELDISKPRFPRL